MNLAREDIRDKARLLGIDLFEPQLDLLTWLLAPPGEKVETKILPLPPSGHQNLILAGRFGGKSTLSALACILQAAFCPGSRRF